MPDLSATLQRTLPTRVVTQYEPVAIRIDYRAQLVHIAWEEGHLDGTTFVADSTETHTVRNETLPNEKPDLARQYWTAFFESTQAKAVLTMVANHLKSIGRI